MTHDLTPHIHDFSTISLEHLNASMELMERIDTKYIVHTHDLPAILSDMKKHYAVLMIKDRRLFGYDSVYFDTEDLESYTQHLTGIEPRWKARSRLYLDSGLNYFEAKFKENDMTRKYRFATDLKTHGVMTEDAEIFVRELMHTYTWHKSHHQFHPTLGVRYIRSTFCSKHTYERVTIDTQLAFRKIGSDEVVHLPHIAILEVKTQEDEHLFDKIVHKHRLSVSKHCSKYSLGMVYTDQVTQIGMFSDTIREIILLQEKYPS